MKVINYYEQDNKEYWLEEIGKSEWRAGKYLYELIRDEKLKKLCGESTKVLLLVDDDKLISFCTYAEKDEIQPTDLTPWMGFVFTFPEFRGHHYFGQMFDEVERLVREDGYSKLYISTDAVGLYEKYGCEFFQMMKNVNDEDCRVYVKNV